MARSVLILTTEKELENFDLNFCLEVEEATL